MKSKGFLNDYFEINFSNLRLINTMKISKYINLFYPNSSMTKSKYFLNLYLPNTFFYKFF